jgi:hypothetical protein
MKKVKLSVLALLALAAVAPSCKKGDEDPGLSLRSRKGRFAGEWKIDEIKTDETMTSVYVPTYNSNAIGYTNTVKTTTTLTSTDYSQVRNYTSTQVGSTSSTTTDKGTVTDLTFTAEKDGTWKSKLSYKVTSSQTDNNPAVVMDYTYTIEREGTWQFLGKNKGLEEKNKESVLLATTKETVYTKSVGSGSNPTTNENTNTFTYGKNENVEVWHLSMLKNKEMKADMTTDNSVAYSFKTSTPSTTISGNYNNGGWGNTALSTESVKGTGTMHFMQ